jgi:hypothetical protein
MLNPFSTRLEDEDIKRGVFPVQFGTNGMWNLLKRMVSHQPNLRPSPEETIRHLETILVNLSNDMFQKRDFYALC